MSTARPIRQLALAADILVEGLATKGHGMSVQPECPRGHLLEPNAVYCTVCWMRVAPEDPAAIAARQRRRRRVWFPLFGAGAVVLGVTVGGVLERATDSTTPDSVVAEAPPSIAASTAASTPAAEAATVTAVPLAGTVADPVQSTGAACTVDMRDQQLECSTEDGQLAFTVCVPAGTALLEARTRPDSGSPWADVSTDVIVRDDTTCDGGLAADVAIAAPAAGRDGAKWRLVARTADGDRLWASRISTTADGS